MSLILHIQTALETAMAGIATGGALLATRENPAQKEHASFLQPAIRDLCAEANIRIADIDAVAVVSGPGSYTGLRVGMAAAKGICFALHKPLITIDTLRWMASGAKGSGTDFICPMIDARRMDVFTAMFSQTGETLMDSAPVTLDNSSFAGYLHQGTVAFFGSGAGKFRAIMDHPRALFPSIEAGQQDLADISWNLYQQRMFSDLRLSAPQYGKAFFSTAKP
jgi:tRNA threonylcarbamoyladenosine biosynthesis protein TsaB